MKDLKDYLHFYIGCRVQLTINPNSAISSVLVADIVSINTGKYITLRYKGSKNYLVSKYPYPFSQIKLILRRLSSMTEVEAIEICKIETNPNRYEAIEIFEIKTDSIWYMDGSKWYGDGVEDYNDLYIYFNQLTPEQFKKLIEMGFDLFGLIDSGLAIDAGTLKA